MTNTGHSVQCNGAEIHYEVFGEGEPLLLLHAFTVSHVVWLPMIKHFADQYQLIIPDLRGHGHSSNPGTTFTHRQSARDMYALMDALGIEMFRAIGHSSGGMTLVHMALQDTSRITSMVLIGSTTVFPDKCRAIQRQTHYESIDANRLHFLHSIHPGGEEQIRMLFAQFRTMAETYDDMNITPHQLKAISCETLIIHGDRDEFFHIDIPVESYKSIPNAYLWVIPNDGHIPAGILGSKSMWTDVFVKVVKDFLSGSWRNSEVNSKS